MPLLSAGSSEDRNKFISRFMSSGPMKKEFPKYSQRIAIAFSQWRKKHKGKTPLEKIMEK